jgi:hypothetical protein
MGIGGCILLFAAGAVLAFGVDWHVRGVDLSVVGVVLMIAGLLGLLTYGALFRRRYIGGRAPDTEIVEERHYREDY